MGAPPDSTHLQEDVLSPCVAKDRLPLVPRVLHRVQVDGLTRVAVGQVQDARGERDWHSGPAGAIEAGEGEQQRRPYAVQLLPGEDPGCSEADRVWEGLELAHL